jgi:hypothetical protein
VGDFLWFFFFLRFFLNIEKGVSYRDFVARTLVAASL